MHESVWRSRGYLPHFDHSGQVQSITIRLADAMPFNVLERWRLELQHLPDGVYDIEQRKRINSYLDAGYGECWLKNEEIADLVEKALLYFDGDRYQLFCWCVMPNHLHFIVKPHEKWSLGDIMYSLKAYTAKQVNKILGRKGSFWQREYYDRFIRHLAHYENAGHYIEMNPVKAGLVQCREDWRWSSARYYQRIQRPTSDLEAEWL